MGFITIGGIKHIVAIQEAAKNFATSQEDLSLHCDQDERKTDTEDPDQANCCAIGAPEQSSHGVSSDTATCTSEDWIMRVSAHMPTGNHRPCETMNAHIGTPNAAIGASNATIGMSNDTIGTPMATVGTSNAAIGASRAAIGASTAVIGASTTTAGTANHNQGTHAGSGAVVARNANRQ